jgi:small GTP-binding protein
MTEIEDGTEDDYDLETFKTVLIGDSSVGKTSIITSFTRGFFEENQPSTSSANYTSKALYYSPYEKGCTFQIWDTCGQEKYRSLNHIFYKDATIAILVYDIAQKKTYESIVDYWYDEVKQKAPEDILLVLCANKSDLIEEEQVEQQLAQKWANEHKVPFFPTSAKNLTGIKEMFIDLGQAKLNMMFDFSEINKRLEMEMQNEREDNEDDEVEEDNVDKKYEVVKRKENDEEDVKEKEDVKDDSEDVKVKQGKKKEINIIQDDDNNNIHSGSGKSSKKDKSNDNSNNNGNSSSNSNSGGGKKKKKKTQNNKLTNTNDTKPSSSTKKKPSKKKSSSKKGIKLGEDDPIDKDSTNARSKCC